MDMFFGILLLSAALLLPILVLQPGRHESSNPQPPKLPVSAAKC